MTPLEPPSQLEPLFTAEEIATRVHSLGEEISGVYGGRDLVALCVLQGAAVFYADLIRAIDVPLRCAFIQANSYGSGTDSSGEVDLHFDLGEDLRQCDVLIVEDIVDTGRTANAILEGLMERDAASISICALLDKPSRREVDVAVRWRGFEIPNRFVVGYGLDLDGLHRGLPGIWALPA